MQLKDEFEKTGNWLFKKREHIPILIVPLILIALKDSEYLERVFGHRIQTFWEVFCIGLSFLGLIIRMLTVGWIFEGTSGRNTKGQVAENLNTEGMYSIVRHPLYLGNFFITFGLILFIEVWWLAVIYLLIFWIFYERIMFAEEVFLENKFGDRYLEWAKKTPAILPNLSKWQFPPRRFSYKMVLKREYATFLGIIVGFIVLKFFAELLGENNLEMRWRWVGFLATGLIVYIVLRTLRKKTQLLNVK